jgi:hypothetical protein
LGEKLWELFFLRVGGGRGGGRGDICTFVSPSFEIDSGSVCSFQDKKKNLTSADNILISADIIFLLADNKLLSVKMLSNKQKFYMVLIVNIFV